MINDKYKICNSLVIFGETCRHERSLKNHIHHDGVEFLEPPRESEKWYKYNHGYNNSV